MCHRLHPDLSEGARVATAPENSLKLLEFTLPPGKCRNSCKTPGSECFEMQLIFDGSTAQPHLSTTSVLFYRGVF